jgi:hypothetical protein
MSWLSVRPARPGATGCVVTRHAGTRVRWPPMSPAPACPGPLGAGSGHLTGRPKGVQDGHRGRRRRLAPAQRGGATERYWARNMPGNQDGPEVDATRCGTARAITGQGRERRAPPDPGTPGAPGSVTRSPAEVGVARDRGPAVTSHRSLRAGASLLLDTSSKAVGSQVPVISRAASTAAARAEVVSKPPTRPFDRPAAPEPVIAPTWLRYDQCGHGAIDAASTSHAVAINAVFIGPKACSLAAGGPAKEHPRYGINAAFIRATCHITAASIHHAGGLPAAWPFPRIGSARPMGCANLRSTG